MNGFKYKPLASAPLDKITSERISEFAAHRQALNMQIASVNNTLRGLRRMLRLAVEWGALEVAPQVKKLPGERHRASCERGRRSAVSSSCSGTSRINRGRPSRHWTKARRMFSAVLGICCVGEWAPRYFARKAWQDGCRRAHSAYDSASQGHPRKPLGTRWQAFRGLGLARTDS